MEEKNTADVHKNTVMYFASNMRDTNRMKWRLR